MKLDKHYSASASLVQRTQDLATFSTKENRTIWIP